MKIKKKRKGMKQRNRRKITKNKGEQKRNMSTRVTLVNPKLFPTTNFPAELLRVRTNVPLKLYGNFGTFALTPGCLV